MTAEEKNAIQAFAAIAKGFCAWCEGDSPGATPYRTAALWLAQLHAAALVLPAIKPESEDCATRIDLNEAPPRALAPFWDVTYRTLFDLHPSSSDDIGMGVLGDDLTDVYLDVKSSLGAYEAGQIADAAWQWRFDHLSHWGRHATSAMLAIQDLGL